MTEGKNIKKIRIVGIVNIRFILSVVHCYIWFPSPSIPYLSNSLIVMADFILAHCCICFAWAANMPTPPTMFVYILSLRYIADMSVDSLIC